MVCPVRDSYPSSSSMIECGCSLSHTHSLPFAAFESFSAAEAKVVEEPYDYIIAGGGLAGCVLAERLSADGSKRILVLEAGRPDYDNVFIRIPAGILRLFRSVYDWQYESGGEKACNGRNIFLQRGKVRQQTAFLFLCAWQNGRECLAQAHSHALLCCSQPIGTRRIFVHQRLFAPPRFGQGLRRLGRSRLVGGGCLALFQGSPER